MALNKVKGEKTTCPFCQGDIICNEKPASGNYPAKLQWQNPDSTAHFSKYDGTKYVCPGSIIEDPKNKATQGHANLPYTPQPTASNGAVIEHISPTPEITDATNVVLQALEQSNTQCQKIYPGLNVNSDTFGMIRNAFVGHILSVYCSIKKNKV
jgi:hypothetical protein